MKTLFCLLLGVLASLTLWSDENPSTNLNTDEIEEISQKREIVTLIGKDGEKVVGKVLEYNGTTVLFQKQTDFQLFRFNLDTLSQKSARMIKDNYSTANYNVPKLQRPLDEKKLKQLANHADNLVLEKLRQNKQRATRYTDEHTFLRRAYLKIIGRIPNATEADDYMGTAFKKRSKLIDTLLATEGYVSHQLNWMSDLLRIQDKLNNTNIQSGLRYREYVRTEIRKNTPYDEFVQNLIAAEGAYFEEGNEEIGYYLRDRGMPLDNLSNTVRVFLGTRLECAMCHNHPFDKWTQRQFYEMSAFTNGVSQVRIKDNYKVVSEFNKIARADKSEDARVLNSYRNYIRDIIGYGLDNQGSGNIKLTKEYMEDDANPGDILHAKAIFAPPLEIDKTDKNPKSRNQFAKWITSESNPRFTTVLVNRLWKRVYGIGLIEPIDDMSDGTESSNPQLLAYLEKVMASLDYDVKEFLRVLYNMDLFTRETVKGDYDDPATYYFAGPPLQRMTGEQLWDSLVVLAFNNIDTPERTPLNYDEKYKMVYDRYIDKTAQEIYTELKAYLAETEKPNRNLAEVVVSLRDKEYPKKKIPQQQLLRSSYLKYPAPGGHLIRQFGGSDKELIENSNFEANTPQVLNMLNGFVETNIINNKTADFMVQMNSEQNDTQKIKNVFLSILGRNPKSKELTLLRKYIDEPNGAKHVAWILLNSHEFMFIK